MHTALPDEVQSLDNTSVPIAFAEETADLGERMRIAQPLFPAFLQTHIFSPSLRVRINHNLDIQ